MRQNPIGVCTPTMLEQSAPLKEAEMALRDFLASSGGDADFLRTARSNSMRVLATGQTIDAKLCASVIAIAAGYVGKCLVRDYSRRSEWVCFDLANASRLLSQPDPSTSYLNKHKNTSTSTSMRDADAKAFPRDGESHPDLTTSQHVFEA